MKPVLAPAEAVANVFRERVERRLRSVAERAERKRGGELVAVNERATAKLLTEAAFTDDVIVHEYLAGVLAGADGADDGTHLLALIGRLSPQQLWLHFLVYRGYHEARAAFALELLVNPHETILFISEDDVERAGTSDVRKLLPASDQLLREGLLRDLGEPGVAMTPGVRFGELDVSTNQMDRVALDRVDITPDTPGLLVRPSSFGAELYRWACGQPGSHRFVNTASDPALPRCYVVVASGAPNRQV